MNVFEQQQLENVLVLSNAFHSSFIQGISMDDTAAFTYADNIWDAARFILDNCVDAIVIDSLAYPAMIKNAEILDKAISACRGDKKSAVPLFWINKGLLQPAKLPRFTFVSIQPVTSLSAKASNSANQSYHKVSRARLGSVAMPAHL